MSEIIDTGIALCNGVDKAASDDSDDGVVFEQQDWDTFGLEFAASQWLKLVINAESLFSKLVSSDSLASEDKNLIEQWLCLKQECEECVVNDNSVTGRDCSGRVLDRIEELTEFDDQTDKSDDADSNLLQYQNGNFDPDTDSECDTQHPEFIDRLNYYMCKFKSKTDERVKKLNDEYTKLNDCCSSYQCQSKVSQKNDEDELDNDAINRNLLLKRRASIFPGTNLLHIGEDHNIHDDEANGDFSLHFVNGNTEWGGNLRYNSEDISYNDVATDTFEDAVGPYEELKVLAAGSEVKQSQIRKVIVDLEEAHKRIEELNKTIEIKEQFIADMIKNSDMRTSAKHRFQKKRKKLEEGYYKTRSQLAQSENALILVSKHGFSDELVKRKKEIEKYKSVAVQYKRRLTDIEMMKQITSESAKKNFGIRK